MSAADYFYAYRWLRLRHVAQQGDSWTQDPVELYAWESGPLFGFGIRSAKRSLVADGLITAATGADRWLKGNPPGAADPQPASERATA